MCECNCMYTRKKRMVLNPPIFTTLKNTQKHYVQISYTEFSENRTIYVVNMY
jgi:hypothetical protein